MAALQSRPITSIARKKNVPRKEKDERGQKREASETPKINGKSKSRTKPRLVSKQIASTGVGTSQSSEQEEENDLENINTENWREVLLKKRKKKKKKKEKEKSKPKGRRTRPTAIAIKVAAGKSYFDVVLGTQEKVNPDNHGIAIRNMTQTRDGNVLIEI